MIEAQICTNVPEAPGFSKACVPMSQWVKLPGVPLAGQVLRFEHIHLEVLDVIFNVPKGFVVLLASSPPGNKEDYDNLEASGFVCGYAPRPEKL